MEYAISLIVNIIDAVTLVFLCDIVFAKKYRLNKPLVVLLMILAHVGIQFVQGIIPTMILLYIITFAFMFALTYFYKGSFIRHFFVAACITVVGTAAEGLVYAVQSGIGPIVEEAYVVGMMTSKTITLIIVSFLRVIIRKPVGFKYRRITVFIIICETISTAVLFLLMYFMGRVKAELYVVQGAMCFLILLLNMCIYCMFDNISEMASANEERIKANANLVKTEEQYRLITEKYKTVRSYIHDTNKHFSSLRRYLFEGKCDEAIKYLDTAAETENMRNDFINSGNVVVDALVNELKGKCVGRDITCDIDIAINNNDICLEAPDFSVVLGNLLDNAYNAVAVLSKERDRIIDVKIFCNEDKLVIKVSNTYENTDMTKGYGIQNIESVVEKYDAIYYAKQEGNWYHASVFIPIKDHS